MSDEKEVSDIEYAFRIGQSLYRAEQERRRENDAAAVRAVKALTEFYERQKQSSTMKTHETILHLNGQGLEGLEKDAISLAMREAGGNRTHAAMRLQITRQTLHAKLHRYKLACLPFLLCLLLTGCHSTARRIITPIIPPPDIGNSAPVKTIKPLPPLPQSNLRAQSQTAELAPILTNAAIIVRWTKPKSVWDGFNIYRNESGISVSGAYDNYTMRGLTPGETVNIRATTYSWTYYDPANEWEAIESTSTPIAVGTAKTNAWISPDVASHARRFTWPCVPNVTNVLQSSSNLTTWAVASRFRGTNGTATVVLTNAQLAFHRVLIQNAPPNTSLTLTQATAYVRLTWPGNGEPQLLEAEADARTGSFTTVLQTNRVGIVSVILPYTAARYRVSKAF